MSSVLLSIAIPAYSRPKELLYCLQRFAEQIEGGLEDVVEIIVSDDCSPDDGLASAREFAESRSYMHFRRYQVNIGLEKNLLECAEPCQGEYLWIFGDDDFIEPTDGLQKVVKCLRESQPEFLVLNRTRRSFDLETVITPNWMNLDERKVYEFPGLREFCLQYGFISVIGFISVNIFRREAFVAIDATKYMGTMYPQLGAMLEAFSSSRTLLVGEPIVCHRTQTSEEKKAALGSKKTEADFMSDVALRNAKYFSHPYINMLSRLLNKGAFQPSDIVEIPENTVINGLLIDFLIETVLLSDKLQTESDSEQWAATKQFFDRLPLGTKRWLRVMSVFLRKGIRNIVDSANEEDSGTVSGDLTISVVTPSFNQAEFLDDCIVSVQSQTHVPLEHLVFDPGSTDGSREVAKKYPGVTLFAEPDDGQSDALNKGFERVQGDIIAWLNSDDMFADAGVFQRVVERFQQPDQPDIVYGTGIFVDEDGEKLRDVYINKDPGTLSWRFQQEDGILQPALFMKRSVVERVGPLRNDRHYCMDYEYWIRCLKAGMKFAFVDDVLAIARYHNNNKTWGMRGKSYSEVCDMTKEHFGYVNHVWLKRYAEFLAEGHDGVLVHTGNTPLADNDKADALYRQLLLAYNGTHDTYEYLSTRAAEKGPGDTLREMQRLGLGPATPAKMIPLDQVQEAGCVAYTVGERRWAFDAKWKGEEIWKAHSFLKEQISKRQNDTCIIVGNGPSLNDTDLSLLEGQDVIISNNAFLSEDVYKHATYYTVVNYLVAEQSSQYINRLEGVHKVLPYWLSYCLNPGNDTHFVDAVGHAEFSTDMFKNMSWRHTVTFFNLHLAYGLGYKKVVLIGFDHNYSQPKNVAEADIIQDFEDDKNHFHPDYFRGKKWQAADVDMMEEMYRLAKAAYEEDGRTIVNATVGGKLELFDRARLEDSITRKFPVDMDAYLIGPLEREDEAHLDETDAIAGWFKNQSGAGVMIDVGAHQGSSMRPFLDMDWSVHAFEPDEKNREILETNIGEHRNRGLVTLDPRCVGDTPASGVKFYNSEQSSGISGLTAFHETHVEAQLTDVTTLSEHFSDQKTLDVSFLKIDTEGHDLFVLRGFPWSKGKPAVIECEFEDAKTRQLGYTWEDVCVFLVEKGYTVYISEWHPIVRYGIRHQWLGVRQYPSGTLNPEGWGNLLAFSEDPGASAVIEMMQAVLTKRERTQKSSAVASTTDQPSTGKSMRTERMSLPSYSRIAEGVKRRSLTLFRVGQYVAWCARFFKRHPVVGSGFSLSIIALLTMPVVFSGLSHYANGMFLVAALLSGGLAAMLSVSFLNHRMTLYTHAQQQERNLMEGRLMGAIAALEKRLGDSQSALTLSHADLEQRLGSAETALVKQWGYAKSSKEELDALTENLSQRVGATDGEVDRIRQDLGAIRQRVGVLTSSHAFGVSDFQPFNRRLSKQQNDLLLEHWSGSLGIAVTKNSLAYMANRIFILEQNSKGRLASSLENAVLRTLVASAVRQPNLKVLEIGSLFGIGLTAIYDYCANKFEDVTLVSIDPMDGYYGTDVLDHVTNEPIEERVFDHNMMVAHVPRENYRLIKGLSENQESIDDSANTAPYDVLIIDGDHSYKGVKADFDNYKDQVRLGGFIIIDDYATPEWPEIQDYVDKELMGLAGIEFVGAAFRSAVFRVVD